jgi:hypothetical protein
VKITEVQAFLMSYPFAGTGAPALLWRRAHVIKRDAMLIRVTADNGLVGYAPGPAHERAARNPRNHPSVSCSAAIRANGRN